MYSQYPAYVRIICVILGFSLIGLSVFYSAEGFGVVVPEMAWVGWFMGFAITGIEIVWNKAGRRNVTLGVAGLSAYAYGITANIMGIMSIRGVTDPFSNVLAFILIAFFSFLIEVTAEPMLILGFTGTADSDPISEIVGNLVGIVSSAFGRSRVPERPFMPPPPMGGNGHKPQFIETPSGRRIPIPPGK